MLSEIGVKEGRREWRRKGRGKKREMHDAISQGRSNAGMSVCLSLALSPHNPGLDHVRCWTQKVDINSFAGHSQQRPGTYSIAWVSTAFFSNFPGCVRRRNTFVHFLHELPYLPEVLHKLRVRLHFPWINGLGLSFFPHRMVTYRSHRSGGSSSLISVEGPRGSLFSLLQAPSMRASRERRGAALPSTLPCSW